MVRPSLLLVVALCALACTGLHPRWPQRTPGRLFVGVVAVAYALVGLLALAGCAPADADEPHSVERTDALGRAESVPVQDIDTPKGPGVAPVPPSPKLEREAIRALDTAAIAHTTQRGAVRARER